MHPHIADHMTTHRIASLVDEAARERLAHAATRSAHRPSWRARILGTLRRRTHRRGLGTLARHA
jgi:hypothetical protein